MPRLSYLPILRHLSRIPLQKEWNSGGAARRALGDQERWTAREWARWRSGGLRRQEARHRERRATTMEWAGGRCRRGGGQQADSVGRIFPRWADRRGVSQSGERSGRTRGRRKKGDAAGGRRGRRREKRVGRWGRKKVVAPETKQRRAPSEIEEWGMGGRAAVCGDDPAEADGLRGGGRSCPDALWCVGNGAAEGA